LTDICLLSAMEAADAIAATPARVAEAELTAAGG
jgi:hypothetical protein